MSNLINVHTFASALPFKAGFLLAFVRPPRFSWFFRWWSQRPTFVPTPYINPHLLVALADLEAVAGRRNAATSLVDAAYKMFDQKR